MRPGRQELGSRAKGDGPLLTLAFHAKVAASPRQVWRALLRPSASARWLPNHEGWIDAPPEAFTAENRLRFRSRLRRLPVTGELRVTEVTPGRVRAHLRLGLFAFDARFSLGPAPGVAGATRIGLVLTIANQISVVSGTLDRFAVRKLASELAEQTLAALASYAEECELAARSA
jgi:hypothetical protein